MRRAFGDPRGYIGRWRAGVSDDAYDLDMFVRSLKGEELSRVISATDAAIGRADRDRPRKPALRHARDRFVSALGGLQFFLGTGVRPPGVDDETFRRFRPLVESLVRRGELDASSLNSFAP